MRIAIVNDLTLAVEVLRRLNPRLRAVGLPWNPAEANSQSYTRAAREAAHRLGLELLEGNVENSTVIGEVTDALVARGAEAILMTGDNTVAAAADTVQAQRSEESSVVSPTLLYIWRLWT